MNTESLENHLYRLTTFFARTYGDARWQNILLLEEQDLIDGIRYQCKTGKLSTPENYIQRFDWLQEQGFGWINLQAAGIFHDNLLVIIETPKEKRKELGIPVTINLSGPEGQQNRIPWKITDLVKILD